MIKFEGSILASEQALEHLDKINIKFVESNLDLIDFDSLYYVKKLKKTSETSYIPKNFNVISIAALPNLCIMQNEDFDPSNVLIALYFYNFGEYFRSSPVKNVTKKGKHILVETENSIYRLTESK